VSRGHQFLGFGYRRLYSLRGFFRHGTGACLGPTVTLGADIAVLPFFLVVVTSFRIWPYVTGPGVWLGADGVAVFTSRPPGQRGSSQVPDSPTKPTASPVLPSGRWDV
jgi:hypothetical protein